MESWAFANCGLGPGELQFLGAVRRSQALAGLVRALLRLGVLAHSLHQYREQARTLSCFPARCVGDGVWLRGVVRALGRLPTFPEARVLKKEFPTIPATPFRAEDVCKL